MEATELLRLLLQKSTEWNLPLAIGAADILKAFDHLQHEGIENALREQGAPVRLIAALLQELSFVDLDLSLGGCHLDDSLPYTRGGKQGGTETPRIFARVFDAALAPVLDSWAYAGYGFFLPEMNMTVTHVIWADNLYVVGSSKQMVADMLALASLALAPWNFTWKPSSLACLSNAAAGTLDNRSTLSFRGPEGRDLVCPVVPELIVLGICLDGAGNVECSVRHRLAAASQHWHARRVQLCCRLAPFQARVQRFYSTVVRTLLYGAGGWTPTVSVCRSLRAFELRCLRGMLGRQRRPDETYVEWAHRSNAVLRTLLHRWGQLSICQLFFKALHGWAGHICRLPPSLDLGSVLQWRNLAWWRALQVVGEADDPRNRTGWRHLRPGGHLAWEQSLATACGLDWYVQPVHRSGWASGLQSFVHGTLKRLEGNTAGRFSFAPFLKKASAMSTDIPSSTVQSLISSDLDLRPVRGLRQIDGHRLCCCVDSKLVASWINGEWEVGESASLIMVQVLQDSLATLQRKGQIEPWSLTAGFCRAVPREDNEEADALANAALDVGCTGAVWFRSPTTFTDVLLHSDGACRGNPGEPSCAAIVSVLSDGAWCRIVHATRLLGHGTNNTAELSGFALAIELLQSVLSRVYLVE